MPFPVDSESLQVYEEGRGAIASLIANIMGILRQLIKWATDLFTRIVSYAGEHPEAMLQVVGLTCIWMT